MRKKSWLNLSFFLLFALIFFGLPQKAIASEEQNDTIYDYLLGLSLSELSEVSLQSSGLFPMDLDKAPGMYYVINKDKFDKYGFRSLDEYLARGIPGIHMATHGNQGSLIGVRGILLDTNSKSLLLRDNINMNTRNLVGINGSKLSTPLLGDIDRIEVALGPGSVRHGSGAINGSINLISATGKSKEGIRSNLSYGSGDSRSFEASYGKVLSDNLNFFLYGGYSKSNGLTPHYSLPIDQWNGLPGVNGTPSSTFLDNAKVGKTDDDYKFSFRAQLGKEQSFFNLDLKMTLARTTNVDPALGYYLDSSASWPDEVKLAAEAQQGRYSPFYVQYDEEFMISPELQFNINSDNQLTIIPFYIDHRSGNEFSDELREWVGQLNITPTPANCYLYNCYDDYPNYGWETHTGLTFIHTYTGFENQNIGWGAESKFSEFHFFPVEWQTLSFFGEDQLRLGDFSFLAGLRYDKIYYDDIFVSWQPAPHNTGPYDAPNDIDSITKRFAVAYSITSKDNLKFSYQEGFRFADKHPQHWAPVFGSKQYMQPEESQSFELNYSGIEKYNKKVNLTASLFYNIYKETHGWNNDLFIFTNSPNDIISYGLETSLDYKPIQNVDIGLSYSYAKPHDAYEVSIRVANEDDTWTRYPVHMFKFRLGWDITSDLFIGGTAIYESSRYDKNETVESVTHLFDEWDFILDAVAAYKITPHWKLSLTAKELLHDNYNQKTAYYQGWRPLDNPRAEDPQIHLTLSYSN